ncbi:helix-turn-helix domain-containing protein [Nonomuraea sp. NPDC046802]|uniref:helix-turn-helix domain-containing protein n=1 Tax=Nonomuraea sp. NPDC046802 TaxID=3154919 RepID=UPI00340D914A
MKSMTFRDLQDLPPTVDVMTAARALGIGRSKAYQLARDGKFPVRIIRIGDLYRVCTADLMKVLGVDSDERAN